MYLCFHWLQLSRRSMGVINTLQQLTFNILPQPLTPLMADWLCEAWEPHSWEWHGSILSVCQRKGRPITAEPLTPANTVLIWGYFNQRQISRNPGISFICSLPVSVMLSLLFILPLPFSSHLTMSTLCFACISPSYLQPLQNTLPSTPHNLISSDVFSEQKGSAFHFNQIQAFQKNP